MKSRMEKRVAFSLGGLLLVVGLLCYGAFYPDPPEDPVRIVFKSTTGNVIFGHKEHASQEGYGFDCIECHHTMEDTETKPEACGECHYIDSEDILKRSEAFHTQCIGCHEEGGAGPVECLECHVL
jgi:hypothetical protein